MQTLSESWRLLPAKLIRYVVIPLLTVSAVFLGHSVWKAGKAHFGWKRTPAIVTSTANARSIEVTVGDLGGSGQTYEVPVHPGNWYANWQAVTLLENPENSGERRVVNWTMFFDLWYPPFRHLAAIAVLGAAWAMLSRARHGQRLTWRGSDWAEEDPLYSPPAPAISGITEPSSAWMPYAFLGGSLGLAGVAAGVFGSDDSAVLNTVLGGGGLLWMGYMAWAVVHSRTRMMSVDADGVEDRSVWNVRRARWAELHGVELVDVNKERREREQRRPLSKRENVSPVWMWHFTDRAGRIVFALPKAMEPMNRFGEFIKFAKAHAGKGPPAQ